MNPDLAAAIVAESHRTPEAAVDLLLEMEATLCDVLLLYAGTPPDWEDGLPQKVLCEWLLRTGDARAEWIRPGAANFRLTKPYFVCWFAWDVGNNLKPSFAGYDGSTRWHAESAAGRYLKRRILSLFQEVKRSLECVLQAEQLHLPGRCNYILECNGFNRSKPIDRMRSDYGSVIFTQTLATQDWIPPGDEERMQDRYPIVRQIKTSYLYGR